MNDKRIDIELMRILACFFVIFHHTGTNGYFLFSLYDNNSIQFWVYMPMAVFCTFSVPLFFCITGALMLNRNPESMKKLWGNRILKSVLILLIWSFLYYLYQVYLGNQVFNVKVFLKQLYDLDWNYSYWYMYAYIPMLMTLPILQSFAKSLSTKYFVYMFLLALFFSSILPVSQYILWQGRHSLNGHFYLGWISANVFIYPLLGYFLQNRLADFWTRKRVVLLWIINACTIALSCWLTYFRANIEQSAPSEWCMETFALINCCTIFVSCKYIFRVYKPPVWLTKIIKSVGGATFGIYLLHIFIMGHKYVIPLWDFLRSRLHVNYMISALLYSTVAFVLGYLITVIIKRIPILKNFI